MAKLITVQVITRLEERFYEIAEDELRRIHAMDPGLRRAALLGAAVPTSVHSASEVDVCVIFDSPESGESWDELLEIMGWS